MTSVPHPRQLHVQSELDVILMRQEVRQAARDLGLGLSQQARISAAISTIARALVAAHCSALMCMQANKRTTRPMLEISCILSLIDSLNDTNTLEQLLHLGEARALVDEAALWMESEGAHLSLRMWLHPNSTV